MPPPHDDLLPWRHPLVRDLAWLLATPDLLTLGWDGRPDRACLGLERDDALADYLGHLEADPEPLERFIGHTLKGRMGHYHERLWQFLLGSAPGTRLLAHNLPVLQERRTLGELDLVYAELADPVPVHLEVAIKYYLGLPEGPGNADDQARWIGPGGLDSLAIKRAHLTRHQLPLAHTPQARRALAECLGGATSPRLHQRLAMPGVLFYPFHASLPAPRHATPDHHRGEWLYWRDWSRLHEALPRGTRGAWLCKPHWLALPRPEHLTSLPVLEHCLRLHFAGGGAPVQLALRLPGTGAPAEWCRLFVVDDAWPPPDRLPPAAEAPLDPP
ncbi:DUF1853 family protein [Halomonas beimenensis]|uniref:DUF1853 family protein n=1 Tax=Halomonas beimenensis TaxID=475662 RepID=A0A291P784_9GAMM|nr:DUF1853 family protein [Halomonas beimenensis]ATJ82722.1 hypothetical protein BEI_1735 [Halomonas beimenensis]